MSGFSRQNVMAVGNDFVADPLSIAAEVVQTPVEALSDLPISVDLPHASTPQFTLTKSPRRRSFGWAKHAFKSRFMIAMLLVVLIGAAGIELAGYYLKSGINTVKTAPIAASTTLTGINTAVDKAGLTPFLNKLTAQPVTLTVGSQSVAVPASTIKSWLQITANNSKTKYNVHVKSDVIASSLIALANRYVKAPVNQVSVTHNGTSSVIVAGQNGTKLTDPNGLKSQASTAARNLLNGQGLKFTTPTGTLAFATLTPSNFDKLIEVNLTSKQMYIYQNGQLLQNYPVSAGGPATPTPVGEFHIYEKLPVQDMWGYGPGHKYYFQPHVYWVNYFDGGDAVHGVYWHPLSWFGNINSSHGCVGVPDNDAEWIYNWAPIGTTVITYT